MGLYYSARFQRVPKKNSFGAATCQHHFIFRKLAMAYVRMYAHQGQGGQGAKVRRMLQWVGSFLRI